MYAKTVKAELSDSAIEMQVPRRREPEHFLLKVESFSESKMEKYESDEFQAGGYKWKLILYPNGDKERNGSNHISLYLSITDTQNLPSGWEVEADFSLFVYNSLIRKYQTYKLENTTRFDWLKTESGFAQLIPLEEFKKASNGYLFGDACVFGAEIFVTGFSVAKRQTLSLMNKTNTNMNANKNIFTWTVGNFSTLNGALIESEKFMIKDVQWNLRLYPKGNGDSKDVNISIFLRVADYESRKLAENWKVNAHFGVKIRNQLNTNHVEKLTSNIFSYSADDWGFTSFMPLSDVNDKSKGFLKNDTLIIEVEITKVEIIK
jgi:hypothetical protein